MKLHIVAQRELSYRPVKVAHKVKYLFEYAIMRENQVNSLQTCQEPHSIVY